MNGVQLYGGRYTIDGDVANGGFATIYRAHERGRKEPVAIKLGRNVPDDPGYAESIRAEAEILQRLDHRNIVTIYPIPRRGKADVYSARATKLDGQPFYFVMEYLDGGTLDNYLEHVGSLPADEASAIALDIARALDYMHRKGYAHNDLKLENIVFRQKVRAGEAFAPVLIDFGVATKIQPPGALSFYIAPPEQLERIQLSRPPELDNTLDLTKVDVWGLGVVMYRMVGGKLPFTGRTEKRITERILNSRPTALSRLSTTVSPELDELIIDGCLAKSPGDRLDMLQLGQALRVLSEGAVARQDGQLKSKGWRGFWSRN